MIISAVLSSKTKNGGALAFSDGYQVHAAFLNWLTEIDDALGHTLHQAQRVKDFRLAILPDTSIITTFLRGPTANRMNLLIDSLTNTLTWQLDQKTITIDSIDLNHPNWGGVVTFADLLGRKPAARWQFDFVTPTTFTKCAFGGQRFNDPTPSPTNVFGSLARRWQALGGPPLTENLLAKIEAGVCVIFNYDNLTTHTIKYSNFSQTGFCGRVTYQCRGRDAEFIAGISALAYFAQYAGVGYHTTQSMGVVLAQPVRS